VGSYTRSGPYQYVHLNLAATTQIATGPGSLRAVVVGTGFAGGIVSLYDAASVGAISPANLISVVAAPVGASGARFDCRFSQGLVAVVAGTPDVTVVFS